MRKHYNHISRLPHQDGFEFIAVIEGEEEHRVVRSLSGGGYMVVDLNRIEKWRMICKADIGLFPELPDPNQLYEQQ